MRQGLLSEPQASSGPAAMLLAVSRSPSSIPRRSPCPERCHLPLAFLYTSTSQNPKNIPDCIHSRSDATFLWRPSIHPPHKIPTTSTPDQCHLPLASLYTSNKTKKPRCPANTTLPDTRAKRTNVKRIFTIRICYLIRSKYLFAFPIILPRLPAALFCMRQHPDIPAG